MGIFQDLKVYVRSGSWGFARSKYRSVNWSSQLDKTLNWKGHTIVYRPGTSNQGAIYEILLRAPAKTEYFVDQRVEPRIVLDFRLGQKNTEQLTNMRVFPFGLGAVNMRSDVYGNEDPNNRGAFSIYSRERKLENLANDNKLSQPIEIRNAGETLAALGIDNVDLLKIDTEGLEYDIISSLPQEVLKNSVDYGRASWN
jgi:FkbM family methyltransferase